jgi:hypothetical protein
LNPSCWPCSFPWFHTQLFLLFHKIHINMAALSASLRWLIRQSVVIISWTEIPCWKCRYFYLHIYLHNYYSIYSRLWCTDTDADTGYGMNIDTTILIIIYKNDIIQCNHKCRCRTHKHA